MMGEASEKMRENTLTIQATVPNLTQVMDFLGERLDEWDCPIGKRIAIELSVEEVYINIASYAYAPGTGEATIQVCLEENGTADRTVVIIFTDQGIPYNPLVKEDPDVTLPAAKRRIGGLGVFLVKKKMDDVAYEFRDGCNVFTMKKNL